jgi:hypothetical protein
VREHKPPEPTPEPTQPPPKPVDAAQSVRTRIERDWLVEERDRLVDQLQEVHRSLLHLANITPHTRGCGEPDDPDCPACVVAREVIETSPAGELSKEEPWSHASLRSGAGACGQNPGLHGSSSESPRKGLAHAE